MLNLRIEDSLLKQNKFNLIKKLTIKFPIFTLFNRILMETSLWFDTKFKD